MLPLLPVSCHAFLGRWGLAEVVLAKPCSMHRARTVSCPAASPRASLVILMPKRKGLTEITMGSSK